MYADGVDKDGVHTNTADMLCQNVFAVLLSVESVRSENSHMHFNSRTGRIYSFLFALIGIAI